MKNKFFCKFFLFSLVLWYFFTVYEIITQLSPTEFYLCIFKKNDGQIFIWIWNYRKKEIFKNYSNCFLVRLNTSNVCNYFLILSFHENLVSQLIWFDFNQLERYKPLKYRESFHKLFPSNSSFDLLYTSHTLGALRHCTKFPQQNHSSYLNPTSSPRISFVLALSLDALHKTWPFYRNFNSNYGIYHEKYFPSGLCHFFKICI